MADVIRLTQTGDPDVLTFDHVELAAPGAGEALIRQEAIGVNYLDITQRRGAVPIPLPGDIGLEGAGRVIEVGPGVTDVNPGDRVVYALGPIGGYASERIYPAARLVKLPEGLATEDAAAVFFKGLTAQYLVKSTYAVGPGTNVLLYGAAGGVGQLLASWARHLGARVIGVVSRRESAGLAMQAGCDSVVVWGEGEISREVARLTDGAMADVVYDGIGRATFEASLASLKTRGTMVSIGASSGVPDPVPLSVLNSKSLFLTRPGLGAHISAPQEYHERARHVLDMVARGVIAPRISVRMPLRQAADAHRAVEAGSLDGSVILIP